MSRLARYEVYIAVSLGFGYFSTLGEMDYIANLSSSIIPWLVALFAVNTTISVHTISHLIRFRSSFEVDITGVINALRRTCIYLVVIIACVLLGLLVIQYLRSVCENGESLFVIIQNSLVVFSIFYYVWAIFDSSMALYDLIKAEDNFRKEGSMNKDSHPKDE